MEKEEKMTVDNEDKKQESQENQIKDEPSKKTAAKTTAKGKKSSKKKKDKYEEKFLQLQEEYEELKDKYLRLSAEFDNYRKRTLNEKMELVKNASEKVLLDLLPIIDDFERALEANEKLTDANAVREGEKLIYNKLKDLLKKQGVQEIDAIGKELDTDYHEALTKIPAPNEEMKGKIVDVVQKGYLLNEKILRYAKVVVGE